MNGHMSSASFTRKVLGSVFELQIERGGQDPLETEKGERRMEENNGDKIMEAQSLGSAALRSRSIGDREGRSPLPPHSPYSTAELQPSKGSGTIISSFHLLKASCVFIHITLFNYNKPVRWDALLSSF